MKEILVEEAEDYSVARIEIFRSPDGFNDSSITILCHIGKQKDETDPLTGYNLFDNFESATVVNVKIANLRKQLEIAVSNETITQEQADEHLAGLLAIDAQLVTMAEQTISLYKTLGLANLPDNITRVMVN